MLPSKQLVECVGSIHFRGSVSVAIRARRLDETSRFIKMVGKTRNKKSPVTFLPNYLPSRSWEALPWWIISPSRSNVNYKRLAYRLHPIYNHLSTEWFFIRYNKWGLDGFPTKSGGCPIAIQVHVSFREATAFCLVKGNGTIFRILRWNIWGSPGGSFEYLHQWQTIIQVMLTLRWLHIAIDWRFSSSPSVKEFPWSAWETKWLLSMSH